MILLDAICLAQSYVLIVVDAEIRTG